MVREVKGARKRAKVKENLKWTRDGNIEIGACLNWLLDVVGEVRRIVLMGEATYPESGSAFLPSVFATGLGRRNNHRPGQSNRQGGLINEWYRPMGLYDAVHSRLAT
jgi:hypothetical protein